MAGPLSGFTVLDLSAMLSGPWAADILGDQGADVIKIEPLGTGEHTRQMLGRGGALNTMFLNINRSKRSVALNLKHPRGRALLMELVAQADVLLQNFRPGVVERMGIGYEDCRAINPRLVYLSISGFGEQGPLAQQRVYDPVIQALSGLTTIQGGADDRRPALVRTIVPDKLTAVTAAQAITAALLARERTGAGQHVRLSMLDAVLAFLWASDMGAQTLVDEPTPNQRAASLIDLIYETQDGYMTVAAVTDKEWQGLAQAVGHPEWVNDPRFATASLRQQNIDERLALTQSVLRQGTVAEWIERLTAHDVPCAPCLTRNAVIEHPQILASDIIRQHEHPWAGRLRQTRTAARFEGTPPAPPRGAPLLGQHTAEVLQSLGYGTEELDALVSEGVIGANGEQIRQDGAAADNSGGAAVGGTRRPADRGD